MPDAPIPVVPGKPANTTEPTIVVAAINMAGTYTLILTVTDDAGLDGTGSVVVTVRPG